MNVVLIRISSGVAKPRQLGNIVTYLAIAMVAICFVNAIKCQLRVLKSNCKLLRNSTN